MGAPFFEAKHFVQSHGLIWLSSNYTLYGDMSARLMALLGELSPHQEIYSIDECFLDLTGLPDATAHVLGKGSKRRSVPVGSAAMPTSARRAA